MSEPSLHNLHELPELHCSCRSDEKISKILQWICIIAHHSVKTPFGANSNTENNDDELNKKEVLWTNENIVSRWQWWLFWGKVFLWTNDNIVVVHFFIVPFHGKTCKCWMWINHPFTFDDYDDDDDDNDNGKNGDDDHDYDSFEWWMWTFFVK